jgi:hypothetical protein
MPAFHGQAISHGGGIVHADALFVIPTAESGTHFAATPIAANEPARDRVADVCREAAPDASVVPRTASFTQSGFARVVTIGLQTFAGWVIAMSMFAAYVLLLKLLAPGVVDWIGRHSLGSDDVWFLEILFAGLVPFVVGAVVVDGLRTLARKGARHRNR